MSIPALISLHAPADEDERLITHMLGRLAVVSGPNREAEQRYEGSWAAQQFGISIPPNMQGVRTPVGWDGTVVDVLEERLDWLGWTSDSEDFDLPEIYAANALDAEGGMAHLDALIFGLSFVTVGAGYEGEPHPLITPHSPQSMTGLWDRRSRRLMSALTVEHDDEANASNVTLYRPEATTTFTLRGGGWVAVDRDEHALGRVPVVPIPNRVRGSRELGRSEITKAVRYYSDAASRTLIGLEVNREFYNAPQRIGLNIKDEDFEDEAGNPVSPWSSIQGRVWNVPPNDDGSAEPKVLQFSPASPAPYVDQVKGYATLLAAEAGIPPAYLGFQTDNPASADAIRAGEARLVKRAERRQGSFGRAWVEVARLALLIRDGAVPDTFDASISTKWRDAATPTRAASADEATKLIASGILPPDSSVTYDRIGLSPAEQRQVAADKRRTGGATALASILERAGLDDGDAGPAA